PLLETWTEAEASAGEWLWLYNLGKYREWACPCCEDRSNVKAGQLIHPEVQELANNPAWFTAEAAEYTRTLAADLAPPGDGDAAREAEKQAQWALYRDLVGNPEQKARRAPPWALAEIPRRLLSALDRAGEIDAPSMCVLADALEEAGCTDSALLEHCKQ